MLGQWSAVPERPRRGAASQEQGGQFTVQDAMRLTLYAASGIAGFSILKDFPDLDIDLLGIGNHRNFLFHSAAPVVLLDKGYQKWVAMGCRSDTERILKKAAGVALGVGAIGIGAHLISDAFHPKAVIFPLLGSLVKGTLLDDGLWLAGNGVWCVRRGVQILKEAMGEDGERLWQLAVELGRRYLRSLSEFHGQSSPVGTEAATLAFLAGLPAGRAGRPRFALD